MSRTLAAALICLALAGLAAWHHSGRSGPAHDRTGASAGPDRRNDPGRDAVSQARPDPREVRGPGTSAVLRAPPDGLDQPAEGPELASVFKPAETLDASQPAEWPADVPPGDTVISPATGAVVRQTPTNHPSMSVPEGALPGDVEIDPATGVATLRR